MTTYFIADNNGTIYAHDIQNKAKAETMLAELIADMSEAEAAELELEVMEDEF